ncbi:MAG TPA: SLC13 family permease [Sneathiellales bacterium]|nr:SLC13 family permease [Sneathiellales bacterium]
MLVDPNFHMWVTFAIIVIAIFAYSNDRIPLEQTSVGLIASLMLFFYLFPVAGPETDNLLGPRALLSGFAEPALITIIALLVIGQAMVQTGALDEPARLIMRLSGGRHSVAIVAIFAVALVSSAVLNNTPVVVIFIPIMSVLAEQSGRMPGSVMIPLSYSAILGGMTTLLGSSTNLLVAGTLEELTGRSIGFFDFTIPGVVLASVGMVYVVFVAPRLLPKRPSLAGVEAGPDGKHYIAQIEIGADHPLIGETPVAGMFRALPNITVRLIQRGENALLPPFDDTTLEPGDAVIIAATRQALTDLVASSPGIMDDLPEPSEAPTDNLEPSQAAADRTLAEVVIAPASSLIGRNLKQIGFRYQTGCIVLGIQRRSRMIRAKMNESRLEAGDVLLVIGRRANIRGLRNSRDVLLLEWLAREVPIKFRARRAATVFATVVLLSATGTVPIVIAAAGGVAAMLALGCINIHQATRSLDARVVLLVGTALAMGTALYATGGAEYLAKVLVLVGSSPALVLSAFFLLVALVTNVLSNNATAVLFTPIGLSVAAELGVDPMVFVYAVIFAANCSFATPMGYQTNLLVMGPGHYQFRDFVRVGTPLIFVIWATFSLFAPWYFGLW